jgi:hypothetical protein
LAVTVPAESILLQALSTTDSTQAVNLWAGSLSNTSLDAAVDSVQDYPFAYRKAIMGRLSAGRRSDVWRRHIQMYIDHNPQLDPTTVSALEAAKDAASPDAFDSPTTATRARVAAAAEQLTTLIGREDTEYLLFRLGPRDGTFASLEPISQRLANYVRQAFVALARADDCECNVDFGCGGYTVHCEGGTGCTPDTSWPMCGWLWNDPCDGSCRAGIKM